MIKGVIFDWAGTTVDFGCFAPVEVFLTIFEEEGIEVTYEEARKPMGMLKIDHIRTMLQMPRIASEWQIIKGAPSTEQDVQRMYASFETQLMATLAQFTTPIPHVVECVEALRQQGIKIGSTTGYTTKMMAVVKEGAARLGYTPDTIVTADDVSGYGRPYPYMIFENMKRLQLSHVDEVIKVGDTVSDIKEGVQAGIYTVGVLVGSSEMGLSEAAYARLSVEDRQKIIAATKAKFEAAGANATIETMAQLLPLIERLH